VRRAEAPRFSQGRHDERRAASSLRPMTAATSDGRRPDLARLPSVRHFVRVSKAAVSKKIVSAANLPFLIFHTSSTSPLAVLPFGKA
jgi:hypothetical protein